MQNIKRGLAYYKFARNQLLIERFGNTAYTSWNAYKEKIATPQSIPGEVIESVKNVNAAVNNLDY